MSRAFLAAALAVLLGWAAPAAAQEPTPEPTPTRPAPPFVDPVTHEEEGQKTVLGYGVAHGGYGAPEVKLTSVSHTAAMLAGMQGGWIIGHRLVVGGAGYGLVSDVTSPSALQPTVGEKAHLSLGYGGLRLGAIIAPREAFHASVHMLVGGGGVGSQTKSGVAHTTDSFFVLEPSVALESNLARHVHLQLSFGYRLVGGTETVGLTAASLSGPAGGLAVEFGEF